jgi:zinc protease
MKRFLLASLFTALLVLQAQAEGAEGFARYALSNGMQLYVLRDRSIPLASVRIAFRAGGIAQSAETAGRFRLLERALLRSSDRDGPSAAATALASLGATSVNGGTYADGMSFWFAVPSSLLPQALGFWAKAFGGPVSLRDEVETAIRESRSAASDPAVIYQAALDRRLFSKYPWRLDIAGSEQTLRGATASSIEALRAAWLCPANAALFVGGDVDPETVRAEAERAFALWKTAPDPWARPLAPQAKPGVTRPTLIVYPDPSLPEGLGAVEARYRGPDPVSDPGSSMAARLVGARRGSPGPLQGRAG